METETAGPTPHHISDVDMWGAPDRNYYVFVALSFILGFFGVDHFYLRSFGTGTQKFLLNIVTLGFWYLYDIVQIMSDGATIRKEGLTSPLDWIRGIGRGTFMGGATHSGGAATQEKASAPQAKKSYLIYAFLAICLGWLGLDKFYIGEGWQGLAKIFSCFNIFLFLFGWLWVAYDAFFAFFGTKSIMTDGIRPPLPYSFFFKTPTSPDMFKVRPQTAGDAADAAPMFPLPAVPTIPIGAIYRDLVAPIVSDRLVSVLTPAAGAATATAASLPSVPVPLPSATAPAPPPTVTAAPVPQTGGGTQQSSTATNVVAGVLSAIAIVGGLKAATQMMGN